jgi:hypothetical protein
MREIQSMASVDKWLEMTADLEGGFVSHPSDIGGATNRGVTLDTFKRLGWDIDGDGDIDVEDLKRLDKAGVRRVVYGNFWKKEYDQLFQPLADILADGKWGSGKFFQWNDQFMKYLTNGVPFSSYPEEVQRAISVYIHAWRVQYVRGYLVSTRFNVSGTPDQRVFERGWMLKHIAYGIRLITGAWFKHSRYDAYIKSSKWKFYPKVLLTMIDKVINSFKSTWYVK